MTSLQPPADQAGPGAGARLRILVVDCADHLGPGQLARLVSRAVDQGGKVVLVAGGTQRWRPRARAEAFDRLLSSSGVATPEATGTFLAPAGVVRVPGLKVRGTFVGSQAMQCLVEEHHRTGALMVAFGREEAKALNELALHAHRPTGIGGPGAAPESRFAPGDIVVGLRRSSSVPGATWGEVLAARCGTLTVRWEAKDRRAGHVSEVGGKDLALIGFGYAVTAPYVRSAPPGRELLVLGDPYVLGPDCRRVIGAWTALAGPGHPAVGRSGTVARTRSGARELASGWPDGPMLEHAGPRPLSQSARPAWTSRVADEALDRRHGITTAQPGVLHPGRPLSSDRPRNGPSAPRP